MIHGDQDAKKKINDYVTLVFPPHFNADRFYKPYERNFTPLTLLIASSKKYYLEIHANGILSHLSAKISELNGWHHMTDDEYANLIQYLVTQGADPNLPDGNGITPLGWAVFDHDVVAVQALLVMLNIDVNQLTNWIHGGEKMTPLTLISKTIFYRNNHGSTLKNSQIREFEQIRKLIMHVQSQKNQKIIQPLQTQKYPLI